MIRMGTSTHEQIQEQQHLSTLMSFSGSHLDKVGGLVVYLYASMQPYLLSEQKSLC